MEPSHSTSRYGGWLGGQQLEADLAGPESDSRDQDQGHLVSADTSQAKVGILRLKHSVIVTCHRPVCGREIQNSDLEKFKLKTHCVYRLDCVYNVKRFNNSLLIIVRSTTYFSTDLCFIPRRKEKISLGLEKPGSAMIS